MYREGGCLYAFVRHSCQFTKRCYSTIQENCMLTVTHSDAYSQRFAGVVGDNVSKTPDLSFPRAHGGRQCESVWPLCSSTSCQIRAKFCCSRISLYVRSHSVLHKMFTVRQGRYMRKTLQESRARGAEPGTGFSIFGP